MAKEKENIEIEDLEYDADGLHIQDGSELKQPPVYSTGSLGLDILSGGFSPGVIQSWGEDGCGKTTLYLIMGSEFQAAHKYEKVRVYLHCLEREFNPRLAKMAPKLLMSSPTEMIEGSKKHRAIFRSSMPQSGEKMYDFILKTVKQSKVKFFHIIDSIDCLKSEVNAGKTMSEAEKTASIATLNTKFLREATNYTNFNGHVIAYVHQVRDKMNTTGHGGGGGKQYSGGNIVRHAASLRLAFDKLWTDLYIYENPNDTKSRIIGHIMSLKLEKVSNSGNSRSKASVPFIYNHGIDREREIATLAEAYGLIKRKGAWFEMDGENIAQGQVKLIQLLKDKKELSNKLELEIRKLSGLSI